APLLHPLAEDLLGAPDRLEAAAERVDVRGVEEADAPLHGGVEDREARVAVALEAEGHRAEAGLGHAQARPPGLSRLHGGSSRPPACPPPAPAAGPRRRIDVRRAVRFGAALAVGAAALAAALLYVPAVQDRVVGLAIDRLVRLRGEELFGDDALRVAFCGTAS